jgi:hypothetical protein
MIKAIDTEYKGCRFRSRLEARWAVFFDMIDMEWVYEFEGYRLIDGTLYLPDFYFPKLDCFAEIKYKLFTKDEFRKCMMLEKPCILLDTRTPKSNYAYFITYFGNLIFSDHYANYLKDDIYSLVSLEKSAEKDKPWIILNDSIKDYCFGNRAEITAKSARFEFSSNMV